VTSDDAAVKRGDGVRDDRRTRRSGGDVRPVGRTRRRAVTFGDAAVRRGDGVRDDRRTRESAGDVRRAGGGAGP